MLIFNLKKEWFDKIKSGEKTHEYRLATDYWRKRIEKWVCTVKTHISHIYSLIDKNGKEKSIMRVKIVLMFLKGYIGEKINVDKKRC